MTFTPELLTNLAYFFTNTDRQALEAAGIIQTGKSGDDKWKRFNHNFDIFILKSDDKQLEALANLANTYVGKTTPPPQPHVVATNLERRIFEILTHGYPAPFARVDQLSKQIAALITPSGHVAGWQPIKTAPKTGEEFIGRTGPEWSGFSCFWDGDAFVHLDINDGVIRYTPTEWIPMPAGEAALSAPDVNNPATLEKSDFQKFDVEGERQENERETPKQHVVATVPCPCTLIEQDEDTPIGYPSLLCGICEGKGHTTQEQVTALACEMIKIASDVGEPEDPFAAWESINLIQSQEGQLRKALADARALLFAEHGSNGRVVGVSHEMDGLRRMVSILDAALSAQEAEG